MGCLKGGVLMRPRFRFPVSRLSGLPGYEGVEKRDFEVLYPATMSRPRAQSVIFVKEPPASGLGPLADVRDSIVLIPLGKIASFEPLLQRNLVIPVASPRLEFARVVSFALAAETQNRSYRTLANGAVVGEDVLLGQGVILDPLAFVDHGVTIGDGSHISTGARIRRYVEIGKDTLIRENSVIGGFGFGFARDEDGTPVRLPHIGGVVIGDRVEIGALNTVVSGTIDPTLVEDDVKSDDHVHIAHNCTVRRGTLLTACAELSGSVEVGAYAWLGPNCSVMQGIQLGERCTVGLGAVVTKSIPAGATVAGNPAEPIADLKAFKEAKGKLLQAVADNRI